MYNSLVATGAFHDGGHLLLEAQVIQSLDKFRQNLPHTIESGGILLGFRRGKHLHVTEATEPSCGDKGNRVHFWRSSDSHQRIAKARWARSGGRLDYVGEWHTHPEEFPSPSSIDIREWKKVVNLRPSHPMAFMILGTTKNLWLGIDDGNGVRALQPSDCW